MKKDLLFVTAQLPYPLYSGGALRTFGLINGLAQRGHDLTLLSLVEPGQPPAEDTPLTQRCKTIITAPAPARTRGQRLRDLILGHPDMERRLWSAELMSKLENLLERKTFDGIHFEGIETGVYLNQTADFAQARAPQTLLIYDAFNAEYALQQRIAQQDFRIPRRLPIALYSLIQARRLSSYEAILCRKANHVIAVSQADAGKLRALDEQTPVIVVPNAILSDNYPATNPPQAAIIRPSVVLTGKMDYRPNVDAALWFAKAILPLVQARVPDAHFSIVGQKPHNRLNALREEYGITLSGWVPDIKPYIGAADVYVAPLRMGSGTRLKLLEAMAMGRAVVSTRLGAEGLAVTHGEHLLLADDPQAFADAVITLLNDETRRREMGIRAAAMVREKYDWSAQIPTIEAIYSS